MNSSDMYQEIILDYWKNPKNKGIINNPTSSFKDSNPSCGDIVQVDLKINNNKIEDIKFSGDGCIISQASASMLTEFIKNKTIDEAKNISRDDVLMMLGIELSGIRLKCALLCFKVFKYALYSYLGKSMEDEVYDN
ncbi:MAG: Fe-S cluster assembly sulfur transfer protein SufU [Nanoarchaeota archaeon]